MEKFLEIAYLPITIPLWQLVLYAGLLAFFTLTGRIRSGLLAGYLFILYWAYASHLPGAAAGWAEMGAYALLGVILIAFPIFGFFVRTDRGVSMFFLTSDLLRLRRSLLGRMDALERTVLNEFRSKLKDQPWDLGKIPRDIDAKLVRLRPGLGEEKVAANSGSERS
jgi:hypothetical protein